MRQAEVTPEYNGALNARSRPALGMRFPFYQWVFYRQFVFQGEQRAWVPLAESHTRQGLLGQQAPCSPESGRFLPILLLQ